MQRAREKQEDVQEKVASLDQRCGGLQRELNGSLHLQNYVCLLEVKFLAEGEIGTESHLSNTLNYVAVTFAAEVNLLSTASKKCFREMYRNVPTLAGASQNAKFICFSSFELCRNGFGRLLTEEELFKNALWGSESFAFISFCVRHFCCFCRPMSSLYMP